MRTTLAALASFAALGTWGASARGDDGPTPSPIAPAEVSPAKESKEAEEQRIARAKDLFRRGVTLFEAGDTARALELFLSSRRAYPSVQNTTNAAVCMERLGRLDEALEYYELVLVDYASELEPHDRAALAPVMASLRQKVGSVDVLSNVGGAAVVIDGRHRGELPIVNPIRVRPGQRIVRVSKSGFKTFEANVAVAASATIRIDAKLEPLSATGILRVDDEGHPGSELFVDGALVGRTPWEGSLAPGKHVVWTRHGDFGSAPAQAVVLRGQVVTSKLESAPLGAAIRVEVEPHSATIALGDATLGDGAWEGRLPYGRYRVVATAEGYIGAERIIHVSERPGDPIYKLSLAVNDHHPRWRKPSPPGTVELGVRGGAGLAAGFGSGAEKSCDGAFQCEKQGLAGGAVISLIGAYLFPMGFALEVGAGYSSLSTKLTRSRTEAFGREGFEANYRFDDQLSLRGPFGVVGASYRLALGKRVAVIGAAHMGAAALVARDSARGSVSVGGETGATFTSDNERDGIHVDHVRTAALFAHPAAGLELTFGHVGIGLFAGAQIYLSSGSTLPLDVTAPLAVCDPAHPESPACVGERRVVAGEASHAPFVLWLPQLAVTYRL